jgi:hypothetical protein
MPPTPIPKDLNKSSVSPVAGNSGATALPRDSFPLPARFPSGSSDAAFSVPSVTSPPADSALSPRARRMASLICSTACGAVATAHSTIVAAMAGARRIAANTISPTRAASARVALIASFTISQAACSFTVSASSTAISTREGLAEISARSAARTGPVSARFASGSARAIPGPDISRRKIGRSKRIMEIFNSDMPRRMERAAGIEPAWPAWKAGTLPLSYAR